MPVDSFVNTNSSASKLDMFDDKMDATLLPSTQYDEAEHGNDETHSTPSDAEDEEDFGDEFDEFEEGDDGDDGEFGDFDTGFEAPEASTLSTQPSQSQPLFVSYRPICVLFTCLQVNSRY